MYVHVMIFLYIFHGFLFSMVSISVPMVSQDAAFCGLGTEVTPCDSTTGFAAFAFERVP